MGDTTFYHPRPLVVILPHQLWLTCVLHLRTPRQAVRRCLSRAIFQPLKLFGTRAARDRDSTRSIPSPPPLKIAQFIIDFVRIFRDWEIHISQTRHAIMAGWAATEAEEVHAESSARRCTDVNGLGYRRCLVLSCSFGFVLLFAVCVCVWVCVCVGGGGGLFGGRGERRARGRNSQ